MECRFELDAPFYNRDAGFSVWTFGRRHGKEYFIKQFLDPVYPEGDVPGAQAQREYCRRFEEEKCGLYRAISEASDGNVVRPECFFRSGGRYYLAMPRIRREKGLELREMVKQPIEERRMVCLTLSHALMSLHERGLVHSDLKPENVLLTRSRSGHCVAKLIDFDASFFAVRPPDAEHLQFDEAYVAPEVLLYVAGECSKVDGRCDVFSLGLLLHEVLTGRMPEYGVEFGSAAEALLCERPVTLSPDLSEQERALLYRMLSFRSEDRCGAGQAYETFAGLLRPEKPAPEPEPQPKPKKKKTGDMGDWFQAAGEL